MAKFIVVLLIICCCLSSLVMSFECLPKRGCDLLQEAYKDPNVQAYYSKMDEAKRNQFKAVYSNHCVEHKCTLDVGCSHMEEAKSHFPKENFDKLPQHLQDILKQIKEVFHNYCGVKN